LSYPKPSRKCFANDLVAATCEKLPFFGGSLYILSARYALLRASMFRDVYSSFIRHQFGMTKSRLYLGNLGPEQ
jgi:hypothetical protein